MNYKFKEQLNHFTCITMFCMQNIFNQLCINSFNFKSLCFTAKVLLNL